MTNINELELPDINTISTLKVDDLRKYLKLHELSVAGKKVTLVNRLKKFIKERLDNEGEKDEEDMEVEEQFQLNNTFEKEDNEDNVRHLPEVAAEEKRLSKMNGSSRFNLLDEATPTISVDCVLDEDKKRNGQGSSKKDFEVLSRPRSHRSISRRSIRDVATNEPNNKENELKDRSTPVRPATAAKTPNRFATIHAKAMEKMETLQESHDKVLKRHEALTKNIPSSIQRLATPKSAKTKKDEIKRKTWSLRDPSKLNYQFGDVEPKDFSNIASKKTTPVSMKREEVKQKERKSVKQRTRIIRREVIPPTIPDESSFVEYISTPKGTAPSRVPKRQGYTPHNAKKVFIDTTNLTDREYKIAVDEGLIPGKSAKKRSKLEMKQAESKKRRDDIIAIKRKLNINL